MKPSRRYKLYVLLGIAIAALSVGIALLIRHYG